MKTVSELLAMANDPNVHHKTFIAAAGEVLGEDCPNTKAEIVEALKEKAELDAMEEELRNQERAEFEAREREEQAKAAAVNPVEEQMIELTVVRKYAPIGKYQKYEDGVWDTFFQSDEVRMTVAPGSVVRLPKNEAIRAMQHKIAEITANSWG